jgi:uncharacterized protein YndB with AHSA1/START domain
VVRAMIELRDTVEIEVPPAEVWRWLERLPEHYCEWHPDHIGMRRIRGMPLVAGSVMEAEEMLHGRRHRLRTKLTHVEPGRSVRYRMFPGLGGGFDIAPSGRGSRFTATVRIGFRIPLVGPLVDAILRRTIGRRLEAIRRHQHEEGTNLKTLLEAPGRQEPGGASMAVRTPAI